LRVGSAAGSIELEIGGTLFGTRLRRQTDGRVLVESSLTPLQAGRWVALGFPALRGAAGRTTGVPFKDSRPEPVVRDVLPLLQGVVDWRLDDLKHWMINTHVQSTRTDIRPNVARRNQQMLEAFFEIFGRFVPGLTLGAGLVDPVHSAVVVNTDDGLVPLEQLSQGIGSALCWVGTLLQRMYEIYHESKHPQLEPALVLIDELDAHMHPEWQQLLVTTMRTSFPQLQVIATTHSPLIVVKMNRG
jgi:hypothetical protein